MGRRPGVDGRERVIAAALRLFASEGLDAVSIRAVNREAGLGPAAAHYHFGTKEALVDAVLDRHLRTVGASIRDRAEAIRNGATATPRDLADMLALPYLQLLEDAPVEGAQWIGLLAQTLPAQPGRFAEPATMRQILAAVGCVYPRAAPAVVGRAVTLSAQLLVAQLWQSSRADRPARSRRLPGSQLDFLLDYLSGGLHAVLAEPDAHLQPTQTPLRRHR